MTNGMERFQSLMKGQLPDRVPVIGNLFEQGARELGMSIREYYSRGAYVAEGQLKLQEKYGYDVLSGFHYTAKVAELLGAKNTIFVSDGPPNVGDLILRSARDIENLEIPENILDLSAFQEEFKTIQILKQEQGGKYPVVSVVLASFSLPAILMGIEGWLDLLFNGPLSLRLELLQKCSLFCTRLIEAYREAGADFISYANSLATADILNRKQFEEMALPWIKEDFSQIDLGGINYFCGGGRLNPILDLIVKNTGLGVYYISPMDDVEEAKKIIAGRGLLISPINDIKLISWTADEIGEEVKRIMKAGTPGGGYIFGTLMMPYKIPEKNIRIMLESAYKYGTYSA